MVILIVREKLFLSCLCHVFIEVIIYFCLFLLRSLLKNDLVVGFGKFSLIFQILKTMGLSFCEIRKSGEGIQVVHAKGIVKNRTSLLYVI